MHSRAAILSCALLMTQAAGMAAESRLRTPEQVFGSERPEEEFETDRDSFTPSTITAATGRLIVESAWSFEDNRRVPETHSFPELVLRYGATDWFELRFGANYEVGGKGSAVSGASFGDELEEEAVIGELERASKVSYGAKVLLCGQDGWLPESSVIVMGNTPTSGIETASDVVCTYVGGWTFDNGWKWDSAIRYGTGLTEHDHFNRWAPSTVLKVPVDESWHVHGEYFGIITSGRAVDTGQHYLSPGVSWKMTENLELGVRLGWGLTDDSAKFFSNVGIGWQF